MLPPSSASARSWSGSAWSGRPRRSSSSARGGVAEGGLRVHRDGLVKVGQRLLEPVVGGVVVVWVERVLIDQKEKSAWVSKQVSFRIVKGSH